MKKVKSVTIEDNLHWSINSATIEAVPGKVEITEEDGLVDLRFLEATPMSKRLGMNVGLKAWKYVVYEDEPPATKKDEPPAVKK